MSATCNVYDLSPFDAGSDSRMNPFKERVNDVIRSAQSFKDLLLVPKGAITTARAKKIKKAMQGFIQATLDTTLGMGLTQPQKSSQRVRAAQSL